MSGSLGLHSRIMGLDWTELIGSLGLHSRIMGLDWTELIMLNGLFLVRLFVCLYCVVDKAGCLLPAVGKVR